MNISLLVLSGLEAIYDYVLAHTVFCLVPAFFIAGAMASLIPKDLLLPPWMFHSRMKLSNRNRPALMMQPCRNSPEPHCESRHFFACPFKSPLLGFMVMSNAYLLFFQSQYCLVHFHQHRVNTWAAEPG